MLNALCPCAETLCPEVLWKSFLVLVLCTRTGVPLKRFPYTLHVLRCAPITLRMLRVVVIFMGDRHPSVGLCIQLYIISGQRGAHLVQLPLHPNGALPGVHILVPFP